MATLAIAPTLLDELLGASQEQAAGLGVGAERTLDDVVVGAWEALAAHLSTACPVCDGELVPVYGAHSRPVCGRCTECGTELS